MIKAPLKAPIWRQYTYFVECPHCSAVEVLGEDLMPDDELEAVCENCEKTYIQTWDET